MLIDSEHRFLLKRALVLRADFIDQRAAVSAERIQQDQELRSLLNDIARGVLKLTVAGEQRQSFREPRRHLLIDEGLKFLLGDIRSVGARQAEQQLRASKDLSVDHPLTDLAFRPCSVRAP